MSAESELHKFLDELAESQRDYNAKCDRLRFLAIVAADELRRQQQEAQHVNLQVLTESQAAEALQIGETTLRRYRTEKPEAWPHMRAGDRVLYTNLHLVEIVALLDARRKREGKRGGHLKVAGG